MAKPASLDWPLLKWFTNGSALAAAAPSSATDPIGAQHAMSDSKWVHRRGNLARDGFESVVDASLPGWQHSGLRIATLTDGSSIVLDLPGIERLIVPLAGSFEVDHCREKTTLQGRSSVFAGPTDVAYLAAGVDAIITGAGKVAVCEAPTDIVKPCRYLARSEVPVELRGSGPSSRQVNNFGLPNVLDAGSFICCEVITPSGNWSTYPAHKHDQDVPGHESELEEIYYFLAAVTRGETSAPKQAEPFGLFSTHSSAAGEIEINVAVHDGDIVLVPYGYHGPVVAAPGYDIYYLNVMAGPAAERTWHICDDPAQAWVRETWADQQFDPRLPYLTPPTSSGPLGAAAARR